MPAKTLRQAIAQAFDKCDNPLFREVDQIKLRQAIVGELRDYMAHEFMIYADQTTHSLRDTDAAEFTYSAILGLFDRLFAGIPAINTEEGQHEHKKRD